MVEYPQPLRSFLSLSFSSLSYLSRSLESLSLPLPSPLSLPSLTAIRQLSLSERHTTSCMLRGCLPVPHQRILVGGTFSSFFLPFSSLFTLYFFSSSPFQGIYWWSWSTDPKAGGLNDTDFTPQNKPPTLAVIKKYYSILDV